MVGRPRMIRLVGTCVLRTNISTNTGTNIGQTPAGYQLALLLQQKVHQAGKSGL